MTMLHLYKEDIKLRCLVRAASRYITYSNKKYLVVVKTNLP